MNKTPQTTCRKITKFEKIKKKFKDNVSSLFRVKHTDKIRMYLFLSVTIFYYYYAFMLHSITKSSKLTP